MRGRTGDRSRSGWNGTVTCWAEKSNCRLCSWLVLSSWPTFPAIITFDTYYYYIRQSSHHSSIFWTCIFVLSPMWWSPALPIGKRTGAGVFLFAYCVIRFSSRSWFIPRGWRSLIVTLGGVQTWHCFFLSRLLRLTFRGFFEGLCRIWRNLSSLGEFHGFRTQFCSFLVSRQWRKNQLECGIFWRLWSLQFRLPWSWGLRIIFQCHFNKGQPEKSFHLSSTEIFLLRFFLLREKSKQTTFFHQKCQMDKIDNSRNSYWCFFLRHFPIQLSHLIFHLAIER